MKLVPIYREKIILFFTRVGQLEHINEIYESVFIVKRLI